MKEKKLSKYYLWAAIIPLGLITVIGVASGITHDILGIGKDYKSEWFTDDGYWLSIFFAILFSTFICLLSLAIFLNKFKFIKQNIFASTVVWFLSPCSFIGYMLHSQIIFLQNNFSLMESIFVLGVTLPHLIGLIVSFSIFRNNIIKNHYQTTNFPN